MRKIVFIILTAMIINSFFAINISAEKTYDANEVVTYALGEVGKSYESGYCLRFVRECFQETYGFNSSACCAYTYSKSYTDSTSMNNIPIGADVFFKGSGTTCSTCYNRAGHIGIYVGNGYAVHAMNGEIQKTLVSDMHAYESLDYIGWGWHGNKTFESSTDSIITVVARGKSHSEITIKWSEVSDATKYKVLRRKAGDSDYVTAKSSTTETSFTDTGLEKNQRYFYKVVVYDGSKKLGTSDAVGAYTKFDPPTVNAESTSKLSLSWDSVSYAESYTVRRRVEGGEYDDVKTVTGTTYTDSGLTAGTRYYYWIQANCVVNKEEITAKSTSSSQYTLPDAPTITSIDDTSKTEITIKWNAINSANSYRIERRKAGIGTVYETVNASITETTYTDSGLEVGTRYYYKVYATNSGGESSASSSVGGYTKFNEPNVSPISETEISLSWDTITAAESYTIRRRIDGGEYADIATVSGTTYVDSGLNKGTRYYYWIQANCVVDGTSYVAKSLSKSGMTLTYLNVGDGFNAYITHASSGLALTQDNDGNVVVRSNTSALNQRWWFERQNDGSYKIRSNSNNRLLDVYGGIDSDGNNVAAYDDNGGGTNQRWFVVDDGGKVLLKPASGIRVLDVANGHILPVAEGTNVQIYSNNNSSAQEFYINIIDKYVLDVNGVINGEYSSHTIGFGTFDVYINGVINEDDVSDFWLHIPIGSTYEIKDIRATEGYSYKGLAKGALTGNINCDTDIQLVFDINSYTVQFVSDGNVISTQTVNYGESATAPETPVKEGSSQYTYVFAGWDKNFDNIVSDLVVNAAFEEKVNSYNVSFVDSNGNVLETYTCNYGLKVSTLPSAPEIEGYEFIGYHVDGVQITEDTVVMGDIVAVATYSEIPMYTVTFKNYDGSILYTASVLEGENAVYAGETPVRESTAQYNYEFIGWDISLENISADTTVTTVYENTLRSYTVQFVSDEAIISTQTVNYGESATAPENPVKEGNEQYTYTFTGWDKRFDCITGNTTIAAIFNEELNYYRIIFEDMNGNKIDSFELAYGEAIGALPVAPEIRGYNFSGYYAEGIEITENTIVTDDIIAVATYSEMPVYTVIFKNYDGSVLHTATVLEGENVVYGGETPVRASTVQYDYEFIGWDVSVENICADTTVTAVYESTLRSYTVQFISEGVVVSTQTVNYGESATAPESPVKEGNAQYTYTFTGWHGSFEYVTGNLVVNAVFEEKIKSYNVSFVDRNINIIEVYTYNYGSKVSELPNAPEIEGYEFTGYYMDGVEITENTVVTGTILAVATYSEIPVYTVIFKNYDGSILYTTSVLEGEDAVYGGEAPVRESTAQYNYEFGGWNKSLENITADTTVTAKYTPTLRSYTVQFVSDGNVISTQTVNYGDAAFEPETPIKESTAQYTYTFIGWDKGFDTITGDTVINAVFGKNLIYYTVKFVDVEGNAIETYSIGYGNRIMSLPDAPWIECYNFEGYYENGIQVTANTIVKSAIVAQAVYSPVLVERVTLNKTELVMEEGGIEALVATVMPENALNKNVVWTSSDETVATVEDGVIMALDSGEVTITVTTLDGNYTANCVISVEALTDYEIIVEDGVVNVKKNCDNEGETIIIAIYGSDGIMKSVQTKVTDLAKYESIEYTYSKSNDDEIKVFIWKSMGEMIPR